MEFFIIMNDQQQGPFTIEQLSGMSIMPDTPVWHEGMADWTTASNVAELQHMVAYAPQDGTQSQAAAQQTSPQSGAQPPQWTRPTQHADSQLQEPVAEKPAKPRKSHTALWVTLALLAVLSIILAITNPDKDDHCRAITKVSRTWMTETVNDLGGTGIIGGIVKVGSTQLIRTAINQFVDVDNYVLFSMGYIDTGAEKSRVSLGILGHVFTFDKNQIDDKLQEAIGLNIKDIVNIGKSISDDEPDVVEQDNALVAPAQPVPDDEDVTAEDRAESTFDLPAEVDTLIKKSAKAAAKQGVKMLEKAIDDALK